jgi:hypothetical protein
MFVGRRADAGVATDVTDVHGNWVHGNQYV